MAQNLAEKEDDDELDGPSLLLQAMEERERQCKEEGDDKSNPKGDYKLFTCGISEIEGNISFYCRYEVLFCMLS